MYIYKITAETQRLHVKSTKTTDTIVVAESEEKARLLAREVIETDEFPEDSWQVELLQSAQEEGILHAVEYED
jgi:hypothetical protein